MNKYSVVMVFVSSILTLQLKYKIMYETLEHWKQYKQEKALQAKIAKEFHLFDKWFTKLIKKNGTTNY